MNQFFKKKGLALRAGGFTTVSLATALVLTACSDQNAIPADDTLQAEVQEAVQLTTNAEAATPPPSSSNLAPAPAAAQELREGEEREEACASHPGIGYASRVVRGVRAQRRDGTWFVGPQVITYRYSTCRRPQVQVRQLPRQVVSQGTEVAEFCGSDNTVWTNMGNRFYNPWSRDHQHGVPCRATDE